MNRIMPLVAVRWALTLCLQYGAVASFASQPYPGLSPEAFPTTVLAGPSGQALLPQPDKAVDGEWFEPNPVPSIGLGYTGKLAYDSNGDRVILAHPESWALSLAGQVGWTRLAPMGTPPRVFLGHTVTYDPPGNRIILFGGEGPAGPTNEAWALELGARPEWTRVQALGVLPPARVFHAAVFDPLRRRILVFGGATYAYRYDLTGYAYFADVWSLSLEGPTSWSRLQVSGTSPPGRAWHSLTYDPERDRVLLFGGDATNHTDDVWALTLSGAPSWIELSPAGPGPTNRLEHTALYEPQQDRLIVFGGLFHNDAWALSLGAPVAWSRLTAAGTPPEDTGHQAVHDPARNRLIAFGGTRFWFPFETIHDRRATSNEVLALDLATSPVWHPLTLMPQVRIGHGMVYDPVRDRMLMFGGRNLKGIPSYDENLWALPLPDASRWTVMSSAGLRRERHGFVHDPLNDRLIGLGGMEVGGGCSRDVLLSHYPEPENWAIPLTGGEGFSPVPAGGLKEGHSAVYDPPRGRIVTFGGSEIQSLGCGPRDISLWTRVYSNSLRTLSLTGAPEWGEPDTGSRPRPREGHSAVFDSDRDRMIIFGGEGDEHPPFNEIWALCLAGEPVWSRLTPTGDAGPRRAFHTAFYDPVRDRMVVFGGTDGNAPVSNELWSFSFVDSKWTRLSPQGTPPAPRSGHAAAYDPVRDRAILFGGGGAYSRGSPGDRFSPYLNDTWVLEWGSPLVEVAIEIRPRSHRDRISTNSKGFLPVAILSTSDFSAADVDPATVRLNGVAVARRGNGTIHANVADVNSDQFPDLIVNFRIDELDVSSESSTFVLRARTRDGRFIRGSDQMAARIASNELGGAPDTSAPLAAMNLRLAWNPVRGSELAVIADFPEAGLAILDVFDLSGRRVASESVEVIESASRTISLRANRLLAPGVYFVRLTQGSRIEAIRAVVLSEP